MDGLNLKEIHKTFKLVEKILPDLEVEEYSEQTKSILKVILRKQNQSKWEKYSIKIEREILEIFQPLIKEMKSNIGSDDSGE